MASLIVGCLSNGSYAISLGLHATFYKDTSRGPCIGHMALEDDLLSESAAHAQEGVLTTKAERSLGF